MNDYVYVHPDGERLVDHLWILLDEVEKGLWLNPININLGTVKYRLTELLDWNHSLKEYKNAWLAEVLWRLCLSIELLESEQKEIFKYRNPSIELIERIERVFRIYTNTSITARQLLEKLEDGWNIPHP